MEGPTTATPQPSPIPRATGTVREEAAFHRIVIPTPVAVPRSETARYGVGCVKTCEPRTTIRTHLAGHVGLRLRLHDTTGGVQLNEADRSSTPITEQTV